MVFDLTMIRILDNTPKKLVLDAIKELIKESKNASFAVGYFYLNGWNLIKEDLPANIQKNFLKILIGRELSFPTFKEIKKGYRLRIKTRLLDDLNEINKDDLIKLRELYNLIKNEIIDFKIYTESKLHSKLYLFIEKPDRLKLSAHGSPGTAILGSSNFTIPGTLTSRELNSEFTNAEAVKELQKWFDDLWDNHSEEFREDLIKIIKASKVLKKGEKNPIGKYLPPKELFKYLVWIWLRGKIEPIEKEDILAQFQLIGVLNAVEMISEFNGCIIADSVGLGKSFIGSTIIEEYITGKLPEWIPNYDDLDNMRRVLLVLPPSLINQWRELLFESGDFFSKNITKDVSKSDKFVKYQIFGRNSHGERQLGEIAFLSLGKLSRMSEEEIYNNEFNKKYDLILIDEAHRYRNNWTNRWRNIRSLRYKIKENPNSHNNKFVLLTATPINNNIWDIYNLIRIFSDNNFINFKKRNINITELFTQYRDIKRAWKNDKKQEGLLNIKAQEIKDNIFNKVIILRTRKYIMDEFGENGKIKIRDKEYTFKDPIPDKITYKSNDTRFNFYNDFLNIVADEFDGLEFSYTKLYSSGYVAFNPQVTTVEEREQEKRIMVPINAILKFLLSKRLESSLFAFERTLLKLDYKNTLFFNLIKKFISRIGNLIDEKFLQELRNFSRECIEIANKEDALKDFEEDEIDINERRIDPRLRLIFNLLKPTNLEIIEEDNIELRKEDDFYLFIDSSPDKSKYILSLKDGLNILYEEILRDKDSLSSIKGKIELIKERQNGGILYVGDFKDEGRLIKIPVYNEPKIEKLKEIIYSELNGKKYIIFTQYKDTAHYIFNNLREWIFKQKITLSYLFKSENELKLALVTGDVKTERKQNIIKRFAPIANNAPQYANSDEIEIIVSTDALSEGVNLQDADGVINFDLPWNPMKIVQRVGRVNRIGNEKDIFFKNFSPVQELETIIGILEKLNSKIKDITYLVGKEFYILSEEEEIKTETFEKKIMDLQTANMTQLEEISRVGDSKILGDIIHNEEIAKFKLLDFIQNELKLRRDDFDSIQELLKKNKIYYTLINSDELFRIYDTYRGRTLSGRYILKIKDGEISESTCNVFNKLWYANELEEDIDFSLIRNNIETIDKYFIENILEKLKGITVQPGFLEMLHKELRDQVLYDTLFKEGIDQVKLRRLVDYLPLIEMNTKEIGEFTKYLKSSGCVDQKKNIKDYALLVENSYDFLKIGEETARKLVFNVLGWCL